MPELTFQVLDGVDRGRIFRNLPTPITIGREEGNMLRLNDERVSRYHAKVQCDNSEIILTDLDSTNGTRVNGNIVQIRRLRIGDRISIGRSVLWFGSEMEIQQRLTPKTSSAGISAHSMTQFSPPMGNDATIAGDLPEDELIDVAPSNAEITQVGSNIFLGSQELPPLPQKLSPSQAARLAEVLEFVHRHLIAGTEGVSANEEATQIMLGFSDWQRIQVVQMLLARYLRAVAEPSEPTD